MTERKNSLITPEAINLFKRALMTRKRVDREELQLALHRELDLRPWHPSPLDLSANQPSPEWMTDARHIADWKMVADLRRQLDAAARKAAT